VRTKNPTISYLERVMITNCTPGGRAAMTGTVVFRWHGPPKEGAIYTVVLDRPLPDGRCMIDAAEHNLLILATTAEKGSR
jgi:hypothetical protein